MKTHISILDFKKRIEKIIQNERKAYQIRYIQDLIKKGKKFPFIKDVIIDNNMVLIKLKGLVDSSAIPIVDSKRREKAVKDHHIILDFKEVEHIDSVTLAYLVVAFSDLKKQNKKLAVINATSLLKGYIDLLHLNHIVKVYKSKRAALADLV